eukprot:TRINITY_DN15388_c0_g1_i2.p2 TRINITY_DN15388_c0_g1~~TRINITY_DN15388_c0_g1_i2.p2  ORF type:complete len:112 (+),score=30.55 TRINITY_DN15388_c0_g1_i2:81-416(+)
MDQYLRFFLFFFFNDTATTEIYTLHIVGSVRCVQETEYKYITCFCFCFCFLKKKRMSTQYMNFKIFTNHELIAVSYTHLRAHETRHDLVCRLLLEKKKKKKLKKKKSQLQT